jgi:hemoglobin
MKRDIESRQDIELLVNSFYDRVKEDAVIGHIFNEVVKINWQKHLPVMYDFWDNAIFYSGGYIGNPLKIHKHLHSYAKLTPAHFDRWTDLFLSVIDEHFQGEKATLAKERAVTIARVMQIKIFNLNDGKQSLGYGL